MALIKLEFKHSKSLKIYPKKERFKISYVSTSFAKALKALNASEKELKHVMKIANMRGEKMDNMMSEYIDDGLHLRGELFIPEYLGFEFIIDQAEDSSSIHIYSKEGFNVSRIDDTEYLILCPNGQKPVVRIRNMYEAIVILSSLGMDLDFETFLAGKYTKEKTILEIRDEAIAKVIENRTNNTEDEQEDIRVQ
jgi:hypothetical protein